VIGRADGASHLRLRGLAEPKPLRCDCKRRKLSHVISLRYAAIRRSQRTSDRLFCVVPEAEKSGQTWTKAAWDSMLWEKSKDGSLVMSKKQLPPPIPNTLKAQREEVLGLSKKELSAFCDISEKTIQRIERNKRGFRRVTYTKVLKGVNKARKQDDLKPIGIKQLFPSLE
jgi:DNA-binding XRE family transcriptional regulator